MFERNANEDQQSKIYVRYLEFCNLKRVKARNHDKRIKINIDDFIDWDRANYPDNPCMS